MDFSVIANNLPFFAKGLRTTAELTVLTVLGGIVVGTPLAIARASKMPLARYPALALIEIVRGTPILMLIFWVYFLLPRVIGASVPAYLAGLVALITFNTGYSAETIRAGIQAVPIGQVEAARAAGLNRLQVFRFIILPQAFANMTPALLSQAVMVYKTTSLVFIIGVIDFFRAATIVDNREFKSIEIYFFVAIVYFVPSTAFSRLSRWLEQRRMVRQGALVRT